MSDSPARQFEQRYEVLLEGRLGSGIHGTVWYTARGTAVKCFDSTGPYERERDAYLLLRAEAVHTILGHSVPQLLLHDDELLVLEMTIVRPPFFLDFAGAYPQGQLPDFPQETWEERYAEWEGQFGGQWPHVERLLAQFRRLTGMTITDVNPGNITF